ncbi:phosphatidylinositol 4-phosphate 3-kinase C2 domain-containing subunit beta-like isoform X3 [Ptychodera flava]|uniref:phosphatidylinositol 4-phosphate 3-kinase C2 domain-containing subunit beta-like isoform X3 n=1 Tax=Ptychodera flava TaxID=63121 RepID=UPI003969F750
MAYAPQDGQSGNSQSTPQVPPKSSDVLQYEADLANALAISKEQAELEKAMALSMESARMDELRRRGYMSSGASYQSALRRSASEGKGRIQSRPRPQRPPPPSSMKQPSTQRADEPNLIDLELDFDPLKQRGGSSVSYREDLLQVFAPGTQSAASANANSTTSVDSGTTTGAFVWNDRSNEAPSISVTATPDNRRPQSNDASDGAMDDILREFDVLEVNRPPRPPRPPSPLQDPNMIRLSRSENNIAANVSWMDFDPLRAGQTQSASDSSLPPSYEESQITRGVELPPSYAESEAIAKKSPSVSPTGYSESHSDNTIVKRPLSPPERPPPPKSPTREKSKTPPPRPKSPRMPTTRGSPKRSSKGGEAAVRKSATWRPISFTAGSTVNAQADRVFFGDGLFDLAEEKDEEATAFCETIANFRSNYESDNRTTNPGHVVSAIFQHPYSTGFERSVELVVHSTISSDPISFTCDVSTSVQHIIGQALYMLTNEVDDLAGDAYMLKVLGLAEYLSNDTLLGDYEYVQDCIKFEKDVKFVLQHKEEINRELRRTVEDDTNDIMVTNFSHLFDRPITTAVSTHGMTVLLDAFYSECKKLSDSLSDTSVRAHPNKVIQTVKAICATLATVETNDITRITEELKSATSLKLNDAVKNLTRAVQQLTEMYCKAFDTGHVHLSKAASSPKPITSMTENLDIRIASVHRLPLQWKSKFDHFTLSCGIFYGGKSLYRTLTTKTARVTTSFFDKISFDQVFTFGVPVSKLPRETRLCFTLYGTSVNSDNKQPARKALGWVAVALFNFKSVMLSGSQLLGLWPDSKASPIGTCSSNLLNAKSVILQVDFPSYGCEVQFPPVETNDKLHMSSFEDLDKDTQDRLNVIFRKDYLTRLVEHETQLIWSKRHYLYTQPHALPWVLRVIESWDWASLSDLYSMLNRWTPLEPVEAMLLLHPQYADCQVRATAVEWIQCLTDDELCDYLTQLVQALKYENYHDSALARFLLERALTSVRIAHYLYWHLKDSLADQQFSQRFQMVLGALLSTCGQALRTQFEQQDDFMTKLSEVAETVKKHKDSVRQVILHRHLEPITKKYPKVLRLPLSPSLDIGKMKIKSCSYFTSFTVPLRLVFENVDPLGEEIAVMYKAGEDLRQDMLTLQMIRLMDKLWLKEGMDLKMITFRCMATGQNSGLVELVPDSETLRKIQVERGVTGSFKDRPLADWLQKYNPTETEYQKAVDNFIYSCAGYCVATYVLGIGDRHNDNIMVKTTGHMFHIDFGKFLGNAQMFGSIKRDRTPFVLTSDMAYVINGGDKPSSRFHDFVDLCCQAFNIVRCHANLFSVSLD